MTSEAYKKGMAYFRKSPSIYKNPYSRATKEWSDFDRGYYQAMRRSPGMPVNNYDDSDYYYEKVDGEVKRIKTIAEEKAIEEYRKQTRGE
jgi:hypothetical protein